MPKITLDEFCSHWVSRTSTRVMASRLEFNVFDFATAAGDYTRQQFVSSFASGGFNGSKWAPRTSKWGKRFTHPLMNDTGTLARSIQSEAGRTDIVGRRNSGAHRKRYARRLPGSPGRPDPPFPDSLPYPAKPPGQRRTPPRPESSGIPIRSAVSAPEETRICGRKSLPMKDARHVPVHRLVSCR